MCFSATASFTLSGVLTGIGAASVARNSTASHRLFAATPLLFAAQQAAEGVVWLTMDDPSRAAINRAAVATFLGLALVVWPMWLPLAMRFAERSPARRRLLGALFWFGAAVAASAIVLLTKSQPAAVVTGHSIRYDRAGSMDLARDMLVLLAYFIPTVGPLLVSTVALSRTIGVTLAVSLVAAAAIQVDTLTSVWCFFAAIVSGLVLAAVRQEQRSAALDPARAFGPEESDWSRPRTTARS